jgi:Mrr N-terminal domain
LPVQLPPVDDDVYAALQERAIPLVDDINSVLRRLLGLAPGGAAAQDGQRSHELRSTPPRRRSVKSTRASGKKRTRAPKGSILPEGDYEVPILRALDAMGGRGPTSEVIALVEKELGPAFTAADLQTLSAGDVRWKNRAQFVRLKLIEKGEMVSGSPRGTWEISDTGRQRVAREG